MNPDKVGDYQFIRVRLLDVVRPREQVQPISEDPVHLEPNPVEASAAAAKPTTKPIAPQVPWRQYYHSRSRIKMQPGGWEIDSDDESDNEWLDELGQAVRTLMDGRIQKDL